MGLEIDKTCAEAQNKELQRKTKEAIQLYEEAYNLGDKISGVHIIRIYFHQAMISKKDLEAAQSAFDWCRKLYPFRKEGLLSACVSLYYKYESYDLGNNILQYMTNQAKSGDEEAQKQLNIIKEKISCEK